MNRVAKEGKTTRMSLNTFAHLGMKNVYVNTETLLPQSQMKDFLRSSQRVLFLSDQTFTVGHARLHLRNYTKRQKGNAV